MTKEKLTMQRIEQDLKEKRKTACKLKAIFALLSILLIGVIGIGVFWYYHPTHFVYNDRFVLGSTEAAIVERYGEFNTKFSDDEGNIRRGFYMIRDNTPEIFFDDIDNSLWYEVYFEDGVAVKTELRKGWMGG